MFRQRDKYIKSKNLFKIDDRFKCSLSLIYVGRCILTDNLILYVKSEKIPTVLQYSEGTHGHACTAAYRATQTDYIYKHEDQEAMKLLEEAKTAYTLVDLSDCSFSMQLKAKATGINKTPTLVLNGRKIKGSQNIKQALHKISHSIKSSHMPFS
jgi:glutaredoxin